MAKYQVIIEMDTDREIALEIYVLIGQKLDDLYAEERMNVIESMIVSFKEP